MHYADLFEHIRAHPATIVLTVNQRLSQFLLQHFHKDSQQHQLVSWSTPTILPYRTWLENVFYQPQQPDKWCHYYLLSEADELLLWEHCLVHDSQLELSNARSLAPLAYQANTLLQQWCIPDPVWQAAASGEQSALIRWHQYAKQYCQDNRLLSVHQLANIISERLQKNNVTIANEIIFVGFDERPPQLQALIKTLTQIKHRVSFYQPKMVDKPISLIHCQDKQHELQTMVRWAYHCYQQQPTAFIGCIIPDLTNYRDIIKDALLEQHHRFARLPGQTIEQPIFNIASGDPLAAFSIIHSALLCISLMAQALTISEWQYVLDSPHIGDYQQDYAKRATVCLYLQQQPANHLTYQDIQPLAPELWQQIFSQINNLSIPTSTTPRAWHQLIHQWLTLFNWPGDRTLTSESYQVIKRFYTLLDDYQRIEHIHPTLSIHQVIQHIKQRCQRTVFQPQTPSAAIQVVGVLESAGLPFTHAWFAHCDANQWPMQTAANPLIALSVQRDYQLPHCDSQREFTFCDTVLTRLSSEVGQLYCSYARYDDDIKQLPSPLLHDATLLDVDTLPMTTTPTLADTLIQTSDCESIDDRYGIPLTSTQLPGGTQLFKDYFACPFRAYAKYRLRADPWPAIQNGGFSALQRGQLIHKALELAWRELQNHDRLLALSTHEQQQLSLHWAKTAMAQLQQPLLLPAGTQVTYIETQRLQQLVDSWLNQERERPAFSIIDLETVKIITLAEFSLSVRLDRLDQLLDGSHCIIDYKTSNMNYADWFGDRIDEPQLPLYCIQPNLVSPGIAFAHVRHDHIGFLGIVRASEYLPNSIAFDQVDNVSTWQQQLQAWQDIFINAARAIQHGDADINPKYAKQTCKYCHLTSMCRYTVE